LSGHAAAGRASARWADAQQLAAAMTKWAGSISNEKDGARFAADW
jgi:hypothetical protein